MAGCFLDDYRIFSLCVSQSGQYPERNHIPGEIFKSSRNSIASPAAVTSAGFRGS